MIGPFEDPAFIAAEAWYLTQPEVNPSEAWDDWNYDRACDHWELVKELHEEPEEQFWPEEDADAA